jgi:hypothetical protein
MEKEQSGGPNHKDILEMDTLIQLNLAFMQELLESQCKNQEKTNSSHDKGFQKLPSAIQAFLLAVGSRDLETPCMQITNTGMELLKMTNKNAIDELTRLWLPSFVNQFFVDTVQGQIVLVH